MAELHHSGTAQETALRQAAVIQGMVADLERTIRILNIDISAEVGRAGVRDKADPAYPILARTLGARRDNLQLTVAALQERFRAIDATAGRAVATAA